jgi:hypothetical protein
MWLVHLVHHLVRPKQESLEMLCLVSRAEVRLLSGLKNERYLVMNIALPFVLWPMD